MTEETRQVLDRLSGALQDAYAALDSDAEQYAPTNKEKDEDHTTRLMYAALLDLRGFVGTAQSVIDTELSKMEEEDAP